MLTIKRIWWIIYVNNGKKYCGNIYAHISLPGKSWWYDRLCKQGMQQNKFNFTGTMGRLTQMFAYIKFLSNTIQWKRVIIDSPGTYICAMCLHHCVTNIALLDSIWFKTGTDNEPFIPIHWLASGYDSSICRLISFCRFLSLTLSAVLLKSKKRHSRYLKRKLMSWQMCVTLVSFHHYIWNPLPWLPLFSSFTICNRRIEQFQRSKNCDMKCLQKRMCLEIDCHQLWIL